MLFFGEVGQVGGAKNLDQNKLDGEYDQTDKQEEEDTAKTKGFLPGMHYCESLYLPNFHSRFTKS